jgi:cellulose synthase (UDP-forming)
MLHAPRAEDRRSRLLAHIGGLVAVTALVAYLAWRILATLPAGGTSLTVAWLLIAFEALPLTGLVVKTWTLWNLDTPVPDPVTRAPQGMQVAVLIPTYNEPAEVIAPTIAAACALEPAHETWVLDDGDRPWVAELCRALGARYVARPEHTHAKAGNLNHALDLMAAEEAAGLGTIDLVAVLDCDHVPLPAFLTATLGWFEDDGIALVQGAQAFYNNGAFDDDGVTGEQGLFFNVLMRSRQASGVGPFWCGSTAVLRVEALRQVGGVATETITEDMHTTLKLIRAGWRTAYHHQTLAVGLAPETPEQYLVQRRRWGLGAMQIITRERLWTAKRWMSWRNFVEYLNSTLWWLEGLATLFAFLVPVLVLASGADTSTAPPLLFAAVFTAMFAVRLWGAKQLLRGNIHWPTAFALRMLRVPVGIACVWWLATRRVLDFEVTPKGGGHVRMRGVIPKALRALLVGVLAALGYTALGLAGVVPWHTTPQSTVASGIWLLLAAVVLVAGVWRITSLDFATSRRNGHRVAVAATVEVDGVPARLVDVSVAGAAIQLPPGETEPGLVVEVRLPGAEPVQMVPATVHSEDPDGSRVVAFRVRRRDWRAMRVLSLWLFHTPAGAVPGLPDDVPAVACI